MEALATQMLYEFSDVNDLDEEGLNKSLNAIETILRPPRAFALLRKKLMQYVQPGLSRFVLLMLLWLCARLVFVAFFLCYVLLRSYLPFCLDVTVIAYVGGPFAAGFVLFLCVNDCPCACFR